MNYLVVTVCFTFFGSALAQPVPQAALPGLSSNYGRSCAGRTFTNSTGYPAFDSDTCFPRYQPCRELPASMQAACMHRMANEELLSVRGDIVQSLEKLYSEASAQSALCDPGDDRWFEWTTLNLPGWPKTDFPYPGNEEYYRLWLSFLDNPANRYFEWPSASPPPMMTRPVYTSGSSDYAYNVSLRTMGIMDGYSDLPLLDVLYRDLNNPIVQATRGRKDCLMDATRYDFSRGDYSRATGHQPGYASISGEDPSYTISFTGSNGNLEMGALRGLFLRAMRYAIRDVYLEIRMFMNDPENLGITLTGPGCFEVAQTTITSMRTAIKAACPVCVVGADGRIAGWNARAAENIACSNTTGATPAGTTQAAGCSLSAALEIATRGQMQKIAECEIIWRAQEAYRLITHASPARFGNSAGAFQELLLAKVLNVDETNYGVSARTAERQRLQLTATSPLRGCMAADWQDDAIADGFSSDFNDEACEGGNGATFDSDDDGAFRIDNKTYCCADSGQVIKRISQAYQARIQEVIFKDMVRTLRRQFKFLDLYTSPSPPSGVTRRPLEEFVDRSYFNGPETDDLLK